MDNKQSSSDLINFYDIFVCFFLNSETSKHGLITNSALLLVKNRVQPMDLVALDTCKGNRLYSFLSMSWGIVADVDIESERYRNLGKARFTVGAVARILGNVYF